MPLFTSARERRLWLRVGVVVLAIYSTLGLAGTLAEALRVRGLLEISFGVGFLLVILAIVVHGLRLRPGRREVGVAIGVAAVYGMVIVRMGIGPVERTHLFEYGLVGVLVHRALVERLQRGPRDPLPAGLAVVATALLGWLDEGIQAVLPGRVYDVRDAGFNALAGFMAVAASLALDRARQRARPST